MINFDYVTKENIKEHNSNWSQIPDDSYRLSINEGPESGKNKFINFISHQWNIIQSIYMLQTQNKTWNKTSIVN